MATAIQFLRSRDPQVRPNPVELSDGMPMVNLHESEPGLYFRLTNNQLAKIGPTAIGPVAPNKNAAGSLGNAKGEMWLDTSAVAPLLKLYDGADWLSVTTSPAGLDTEIQFNDKGVFGADPSFTYDGVIVRAPAFAGDGSQLTNLNIPGSLTFKGDVNVTLFAPPAETGDYYLNIVEGAAEASWTGVVGQIVQANQFIYYTIDSEWVLGSVQDSEGVVTVAGAQFITGAKSFTATLTADDVVANSINVEELTITRSTSSFLTQETDTPDTLATKSYVDFAVENNTYWDRTNTTLSPSESGDGIFSEGALGVGGGMVSPLIILGNSGDLTVNGPSLMRGALEVTNNAEVTGKLDVTGDATCAMITASIFDLDSLPALT